MEASIWFAFAYVINFPWSVKENTLTFAWFSVHFTKFPVFQPHSIYISRSFPLKPNKLVLFASEISLKYKYFLLKIFSFHCLHSVLLSLHSRGKKYSQNLNMPFNCFSVSIPFRRVLSSSKDILFESVAGNEETKPIYHEIKNPFITLSQPLRINKTACKLTRWALSSLISSHLVTPKDVYMKLLQTRSSRILFVSS